MIDDPWQLLPIIFSLWWAILFVLAVVGDLDSETPRRFDQGDI